MKRIGMTISIRPEKIEEYKYLHANVWPEVLKNLKELNCRNYSIFLHNNILFGYMEYYGDNYDRDMKLMAENKPFKRLIIAFMIGGIAVSITTPLYLFFITYVLNAEDMAIYMLTVFYLSSIAAVPFWVWLSTHIGKHRSYVMGLSLIALAHPFYLLLGEGDFWWMLPITVITGFSGG